jgi:thiosulfate/3-mercaptopyruvate sulfurtransferase
MDFGPLVTPAWLFDQVGHRDLVVVDCRWALGSPGAGRRAWEEGHIPSAHFLDVDEDLSRRPRPGEGRHPLPDADDFAAVAASAGIGAESAVVAYDESGEGGAARLWWLLRHFGHQDCAVLDLEAWHGPLVSGEEEVEPGTFVPRERVDDTISREELAELRGGRVVVDARAESRWRGEPNPIDRVPGRIPGSINAPWSTVGESARDLPAGDLVAYCGSGVGACVVLHRLHLTGRDGRLYPGSWSEWEQYPELPVERST